MTSVRRIIIRDIDNESIYPAGTGENAPVYYAGKFGYLPGLVKPGMRLNIISTDESREPELIVVEPDYLADISNVAECFETYATSQLVSLIKKIQPEQLSRAILLGGFAGQLLDEIVHRRSGEAFNYSKSINSYFRSAALRMAACPDLDSRFHTDAMFQQRNIEKAIRQILPQTEGYNSDCVIVEPSFFCETLGLQGRMDMLQTDFSILIEQKSGKGGWGSDEHGSPLHRESHLVQLILYKAILHYGFDIPNRKIKSMLLYSKYPEPLISPDDSYPLLLKAMEMRNKIVVNEINHSKADGFDLLDRLSPEILNENGISGKLWDNYVYPQLCHVLMPYHHADSLTRRYVKRLMSFVAAEHLFAKTGSNPSMMSSGFSGAWLTSLEEKRSVGDIYDTLSIDSTGCDENGNIVTVTVKIPDDNSTELANFRVGDIVVLYSYDQDEIPDLRKSIVIRASIESIDNMSVKLLLRSSQSNHDIFSEERPWAIEHDLLDSPFRSLYRAIYSLLYTSPERADLILGRRKPGIDNSVVIKGDYGEFNNLVQRAVRSTDVFAVIGPPGTGKTSFGMLNILIETLQDPSAAVIATAYTNRAVDEICSKLDQRGIDFMRLGNGLGCSPEYRNRLLSEKVAQCSTVGSVRQLVASSRVVVGTLQSIASSSAIFSFRKFNLAIVDEASQILEPQMLQLLCVSSPDGKPAISRFVLIGDHKQLPAVVQQPAENCRVDCPELIKIGLTDCRRSFFERFLDLAVDPETGDYDPQLVYRLSRQGRMHVDISGVVSELFYDNRLEVVPMPHQVADIPQVSPLSSIGEILNRRRISFIDVVPDSISDTGNYNTEEADMIAKLVLEIYHRESKSFDPTTSLGIIVPYRNQISVVRAAIVKTGISLLRDITIDTVERYQGSQRDYIIYGFTVSRSNQMPFLTSSRMMNRGVEIDRKLNVALTRARSHVILVGNRRLLSTDSLLSMVLNRLTEEPQLLPDDNTLINSGMDSLKQIGQLL